MRTIALTHVPSPRLGECELTFLQRAPIDYPRALDQHENYRRVLRECGAEVHVLDANRDMPDSVFIEDTAVVLDEVAILASMGVASRRGEPAGIEPELRKYRDVVRIELPATLDGGDVVVSGRSALIGLSSRTNRAAVEAVRAALKYFGYEVLSVPLTKCLHLKSACTALPDGKLLVDRDLVEPAALGEFEMIPTAGDEQYAGDVAVVNSVVIADSAYPHTIAGLKESGYNVRSVDLSEFAKAEGGVTCLSLIFGA